MNESSRSQIRNTGTLLSFRKNPENIRNRITNAGASCGAISTELKDALRHIPSPIPAKFSSNITPMYTR